MKEIEERFLDDVKDHSMEILMENGVYRHIKFSRNGSNDYRFDLITFPGHLLITGDMGDMLFERVHDMFNFFRHEHINPGYWSEKIEAKDREIVEFDFADFKEQVNEFVDAYIEDHNMDREDSENLKWEVSWCVLDAADEYDDIDSAHTILNDFEHDGFKFVDTFEWKFEKYTHHYIWKLYAIVWGIQKYDEYMVTKV